MKITLLVNNLECRIYLFNLYLINLNDLKKTTIDDDQELEKLKQSYESLLRFSFLAQDEEQFSNTLDSSKDQLQNLFVSTKLGQISPEGNKSENKSPSQQIATSVNNQNNDLSNQDILKDNK